jgi:anti-sigma regulatory factor (Ser/Thr protein kinase)
LESFGWPWRDERPEPFWEEESETLEDLSLHILDVAENGLRAGARHIWIRIREDRKANLLEVEIEDDGRGMDPDMAKQVLDPFVTTRTTRRVGLGLPLLDDAARMAGGSVELTSEAGKGTRVRATFQHDHIDRKPLGDMGATLVALILGSPQVEVVYEHGMDGELFQLDTEELRRELSPVPLDRPEVLQWIRERVGEGLQQIGIVQT